MSDDRGSDAEPRSAHRSGFACLVGRPNAGKSTLTNALVGEKVAITSSKPQTTRHAVRGIVTRPLEVAGRAPGILYMHAHGNWFDIGANELLAGDPAIKTPLGPVFAREGYVSLCLELPLFGTIPAGRPSANEALADGQVPIDPVLFRLRPREEAFALKVRGDSMEGAGIIDGDLVILACREPKARDIVGALVDGESTLKRLTFEHGKPVLLAENPRYQPIIATEELLIQGVYVGHIRVSR